MERWQTVNLANFNGPLDLLLHMIKEKEVAIEDVNLTELSNQYIDYIYSFSELNLEVASEYLTMAAYLIEIKTKFLIPKMDNEILDEYENLEKDELVRKLLEYHKIKEVTSFFKDQQTEFLKTFSKDKSEIKVAKINEDSLPLAFPNIDLDKFSKIFLKILEKNKLQQPKITILETKHISTEMIKTTLLEMFQSNINNVWNLEELLLSFKPTISTLIAIFITLLDLAKKQIVVLSQKEDDIIVKYISDNEMIGEINE
ncbi:segregation and condensation protein A [Spiroplasma endosymbiont of Labia minor]|uniref:segregation and condensation protein A n=1 Tax=Spiroplasma endosymbiont of Labia minor TaxID=3066305 RepID=UPI0030D1D844